MEIRKFKNKTDLIKNMPKNKTIADNYLKAWYFINNPKYTNIMVSISGGSDSDIMLDICYRCDKDNKCNYIWFDTGLEYQATKEHLVYLEQKYNITIERERAIIPIPKCCKEYGQPFISKLVSQFIGNLQKYNFKFEDKSFDELYKEYPNCKSALEWWCNLKGEDSFFNISRNKFLKEFLIDNPPKFKISNKCCKYAKKEVSKNYVEENNIRLVVIGIRKSEGGARSTMYKSCFLEDWENDNYMPLFWYKNSDKKQYELFFEIKHSRCYTDYGFVRTGCACCPYGYLSGLMEELEVAKKYEPNLYKAVCNIFSDSFEYTKQYLTYKEEREKKQRNETRRNVRMVISKVFENIDETNFKIQNKI